MHPQPQQEITEHTPIAYYQPIAITPALIKWVAGAIIATLSYAFGTGLLFMPAKDTDLKEVRAFVELVRADQEANRKAVQEISGAVHQIKLALDDVQKTVKATKQTVKRQN